MNQKIRDLQDQIKIEETRIRNCNHEYDDPFSNPEESKEAYGSKMVAQGSDIWPEPEGYRDVTIPRWTRICAECGNEQHTYKKKPVVSDYVPDFS